MRKIKDLSIPKSAVCLALLTAFLTACGATGFTPPSVEGKPSITQNPLVAQYTVAGACTGQARVEFGPDTSYGRQTAWYPVSGQYQRSTILVAGMRASTTYHMRSQLQCLGGTATSADSILTTGALPASPTFPAMQVSRPNASVSSLENPGVELVTGISSKPNVMQAYVTDRDGYPIWYYDVGAANGSYPFNVKLLPNGHVILSIVTPTDSILREVDLTGTTIRELKVTELAQKMQNAGFDFVPNFFHHEILPLDNGHLIVLTNFNKGFTDLPGYPGTTKVIGDGIVDLDQNWNPVWAWNSFDYLDVNRHLFGLPDWTHSNALLYSPADGNLILSVRHQSWLLKIDYNNGAGTGNVLWRLGYQGDFALTENSVPSDDPGGWFSFQHFPSLVSQTGPQTTLAIWDNGDFRPLVTGGICGPPPSPICYSRATIFQVDESAKVANLLWDFTPGVFSIWGGSVNQFPNGNVEFDANAITLSDPNVVSEVQEVTSTSAPELVWKMDFDAPVNAYRAYRIPSLYPGVTWQY